MIKEDDSLQLQRREIVRQKVQEAKDYWGTLLRGMGIDPSYIYFCFESSMKVTIDELVRAQLLMSGAVQEDMIPKYAQVATKQALTQVTQGEPVFLPLANLVERPDNTEIGTITQISPALAQTIDSKGKIALVARVPATETCVGLPVQVYVGKRNISSVDSNLAPVELTQAVANYARKLQMDLILTLINLRNEKVLDILRMHNVDATQFLEYESDDSKLLEIANLQAAILQALPSLSNEERQTLYNLFLTIRESPQVFKGTAQHSFGPRLGYISYSVDLSVPIPGTEPYFKFPYKVEITIRPYINPELTQAYMKFFIDDVREWVMQHGFPITDFTV